MKKIKLPYPWFSTLTLIATSSLFLITISQDNQLIPNYWHVSIPNELFYGIYAIALLVIILDIYRFHKKRQRYQNLINELFQAKKQLQQKAHNFSGHADKLKLFISDRLLEYIQYDEKFLHFKNIASEVRHNGVICFDKVQNALKEVENKSTAQGAEASMRYLWDLLDLSTTDNIALHIGNYLCECEEYYVQSIMQEENPPPFPITYSADNVLLNCLADIAAEPNEIHKLTSDTEPENTTAQKVSHCSDNSFSASIQRNITLLGNENHFRLLAENLLNNAQFYGRKRGGGKSQPPIAVALMEHMNQCQLSIYNRGQTIQEDELQRIFNLGYSSRRKKENHGKGLGLYFVKSIVDGYEGKIAVNNITNHSDTYTIRIETDDGTVSTEMVEITLIENQPIPVVSGVDNPVSNLEWKLNQPLQSIEIFSKLGQKTFRFTEFNDDINALKDPDTPVAPLWELIVKKHRKSTTIRFNPLDRSGVEFVVTLPTAQSRVDYSLEELEEDSENESYDSIIEMESRFK